MIPVAVHFYSRLRGGRIRLALIAGQNRLAVECVEPVIPQAVKRSESPRIKLNAPTVQSVQPISILLLPLMICSASASPIAAECLIPWPEHRVPGVVGGVVGGVGSNLYP